MKILFLFLLPALFKVQVSFCQPDSCRDKYPGAYPYKHFTNPFYKKVTPGHITLYAPGMNTQTRVSLRIGNSYPQRIYLPAMNYRTPAWKEIINLAGQLMLSVYTDKYSLRYISPR